MPKLLYACLGSVLGMADAPFDSSYDEACRQAPKLSTSALYAWSLAHYDDRKLGFGEINRFERDFDQVGQRHGWHDTAIEDILPDICCLMLANDCRYHDALLDLFRMWLCGQRYAGTSVERKSALVQMTEQVVANWIMIHKGDWHRAKADAQDRDHHDHGSSRSHEQTDEHRSSSHRSNAYSESGSNSRRDKVGDLADAYEVLGVSPLASLDEIKTAYRKAMTQWHPDKLEGMAPELREFATHRVAIINSAYARIRGKPN